MNVSFGLTDVFIWISTNYFDFHLEILVFITFSSIITTTSLQRDGRDTRKTLTSVKINNRQFNVAFIQNFATLVKIKSTVSLNINIIIGKV